MYSFPDYNPSFGTGGRTKARIMASSFGDGYSQRTADGINFLESSWNLKFENLTSTEADTIENFLIARGGYEAFYWEPPRSNTTLKWICKEWERAPQRGVLVSITATFERVFDL